MLLQPQPPFPTAALRDVFAQERAALAPECAGVFGRQGLFVGCDAELVAQMAAPMLGRRLGLRVLAPDRLTGDAVCAPAELPFPDGLDLKGEAGFWHVWNAQLVQRGLPAVGLPSLTVSTNLIGSIPVGVEIVASHFREDLCLLAGKAIEARGTPVSPIDPVAIAENAGTLPEGAA